MRKNKEKMIITGTDGFVGKNLAKIYSKYFLLTCYYKNKKPFKNKNIIFIKKNLKKIKKFNKADYLIHCASATPPKYSPKKCLEENNLINKNLIMVLKKSVIKKIFFLSSISVYQKRKATFLKENSDINNRDLYGKSKLFMENQLKKISNNQIFILRLSSVIGNGSHSNFLSVLAQRFAHTKTIKVFNKNKKFNSCIHIENLSKLILKLIKIKIKKNYEIFNICSSSPIKIVDIISLYKKYLNKKIKINFISKDFFSYTVDYSNLRNYKINLETTKANIIKFLSELKKLNNDKKKQ